MKTPKKGKYQIMPALAPAEYAALKASIAERGVDDAPVEDEEGNLLDGWHREQICTELGIPCPKSEIKFFTSEADKLAYIVTINIKRRRQLNRKQRREVIAEFLSRCADIGNNTLAKLIGVSQNTVSKVRSKLEAASQIEKLPMRRGTDGKLYPAKYTIIANTPKEAQKAREFIRKLPESANGKTLDATTAARRARRNVKKAEREGKVITPLPEDSIRLYHCAFQQLEQVAGIAPASVHLVCTDIPYGKDFLPQIGELAELAKRILVEGGLFVMHSGQYYLDQVMRMLGDHLTWRWMGSSEWAGDANMVHPLEVASQWKPILIYSKGPWVKRNRWGDVFRVTTKEKDCHAWQQPLEQIEMLVRQFSNPGDLIVDPCGGGFTTAVACKNLNRQCISCDVDKRAVLAGQERLGLVGVEKSKTGKMIRKKEAAANKPEDDKPLDPMQGDSLAVLPAHSHGISIHRAWCMPNHETFRIKPIRELLQKYNVGTGWIDPFAGDNSPAQFTNDHDPSKDTMFHLDALEFVRSMQGTYFGALFDPPFSPRQISEHYRAMGKKASSERCLTQFNDVKDELANKVTYCITCGWNSNGLGKKRGFEIIEVLLVAHGGNHNDTIVTVERKCNA